MNRKKLVAANWKMNGKIQSNGILLETACAVMQDVSQLDLTVCIPFPFLFQGRTGTMGSKVQLGAQDLSPFSAGPYTGDVSANMLAEMGVQYVIVGHSERRQIHLEDEPIIVKKAYSAIEAGLKPIYCIGESKQIRQKLNLKQPYLGWGTNQPRSFLHMSPFGLLDP